MTSATGRPEVWLPDGLLLVLAFLMMSEIEFAASRGS